MPAQPRIRPALALLLALVAPVFGQSALDGFDPNVNGPVHAIAVQADGNILIGGYFSSVAGTNRGCLARLHADGTLDPAFDAPVGGGYVNEVDALAIQPDGKIVVGGYFTSLGGQPRTHLGRLHPDGTVDMSFTAAANNSVECILPQPDGKFLVGGYFSTLAGQPRMWIGRFNADGQLDETFHPDLNGSINSMALQRDGKIVIGGQFNTVEGQTRINLARLNPDGTLDPAFNPGSILQWNPDANVLSIVLQADGTLWVAGYLNRLGGRYSPDFLRISPKGIVDPAFSPETGYAVHSLAVQPDGKILIGGSFTNLAGAPRRGLGRLNPDGSVDTAFAPEVDRPLVGNFADVTCLAVQPDGKILVGGDFTTLAGQPRHCLGRLYPDGSLDGTLASGADDFWVQSLAVEGSGKVLFGGRFTTLNGQPHSSLGRFNADGNLDGTFTTEATYGSNPSVGGVYCIGVQMDGKILVGGYYTQLGGQPIKSIGRLHPDGSVDTNFNAGDTGNIYAMAVQADGKILVGGAFTRLGGQSRTNLGRLYPDGRLDMSFAPEVTGIVEVLALQADGKILVGGQLTSLGGQPRSFLGRLNADGTLDTSFDPGADDWVRALAVQSDGKILVGGLFATLGGQPRSHIGRLNADGSLDMTFNPGSSAGGVLGLALQADGCIIVAGSFVSLGGQQCINLGRLRPGGSLDTSFKCQAGSPTYGVALQADGKVVVGGYFINLAGESRNHIGRLSNPTAALQSLATSLGGTAVTWNRSGASPEVEQVIFERSLDGVNYTMLGNGRRISGGWQLTGLALPVGQNYFIRARGRTTGGQHNSSSGLVESVAQFYDPVGPPQISGMTLLGNGAFQFEIIVGFRSPEFIVLATTNLSLPASNWTVLGPPTPIAGGMCRFTDPNATNYPCRFYQLRWP